MEKGRCETAQFSSHLSLLLACGAREVLKLAGIQLVSTGRSPGAGWQSLVCLSFTALTASGFLSLLLLFLLGWILGLCLSLTLGLGRGL